jgi:hypothetical protein
MNIQLSLRAHMRITKDLDLRPGNDVSAYDVLGLPRHETAFVFQTGESWMITIGNAPDPQNCIFENPKEAMEALQSEVNESWEDPAICRTRHTGVRSKRVSTSEPDAIGNDRRRNGLAASGKR